MKPKFTLTVTDETGKNILNLPVSNLKYSFFGKDMTAVSLSANIEENKNEETVSVYNLDKFFSNTKEEDNGCDHAWSVYTGLEDTYLHCLTCGVKKDVLN